MKSQSANDDGFDDFTFYLMLGARLDRPTALRAADAFQAGSEVMYKRAGVTCFRASIAARNGASNEFLRTVVGQWAKSMPDAAIDGTAIPLVFHSCDSRARATTPSATAVNQATALASCAARLLVQQPRIRNDIVHDTSTVPRADILRMAAAAGSSCRLDLDAGIP